MKHKTLMIAALCTALAATLAQPARCEWHWQTTQITSTFKQWRNAVVSDQAIYYGEMASNGISSVYAWTGAQGSRRLIGGDGISRAPAAVSGDNVVISRIENGQHKLYLYDSGGIEKPVATSAGDKGSPDIYNSTVVYEDYQSGTPQVWVWDPVAGARAVSPSGHAQQLPRIYGDSVVWQESRTLGRTDVFMWNPREGEKKLSTYIYGMDHPDIYGDTVVMSLHWQAGMYDPYGIWQWKAGQGLVGPLVPNYESTTANHIYGDLLVWGGGGRWQHSRLPSVNRRGPADGHGKRQSRPVWQQGCVGGRDEP